MFFYDFNQLDYFIENSFIHNLKQEQEFIISILDLYEHKKTNLLTITNHMIELTHSIDNNKDKEQNFHSAICRIKKII